MTRMASIEKRQIKLTFPYNETDLNIVRGLPDRTYRPSDHAWLLPATPFHAAKVVETLQGWLIEPEIYRLNQTKKDLDVESIVMDDRLYDFQAEGVRFMLRTGVRTILADEMGLGKTAQALALIQAIPDSRALVIAPANVIYKWEAEAKFWTTKSIQVVEHGKSKLNGSEILIMSYDIMRTRFEELIEVGFDITVFDEFHKLKNFKSQRTRAAKRLVTHSGIERLAFLSGTPLLNHTGELYTALNMIDPDGFPNYFEFAKRYMGAVQADGHWYFPNQYVVTNIEELKMRLARIMIRRTKQEVLKDLPPKTRTIVPVSVSSLSTYKQLEKDAREWRKNNPKATTATALTSLTALRKHVGMLKVEATVSLAQDILDTGEPVVIYCHHRDVVHNIKLGLEKNGHAGEAGYAALISVISGDTSAKERQNIVRQFQDGIINVVIMTSAGAEGIDLFRASNIIFAEREWTPATEEQAEDRLHRNGQRNAVNCWYIAAKGTVDEKLARKIAEKRETVGRVITQTEILQTLFEGE